MTILIEGAPRLMAVVIFLRDRHLVIFREPDAVARQILEQSASTLLEIHFPSFLPRHDFLGKHVIHHHRYDGEKAIATPEPFIDPLLDDRHIGFVLLQHEFDDLQTERHMAAFVRLR